MGNNHVSKLFTGITIGVTKSCETLSPNSRVNDFIVKIIRGLGTNENGEHMFALAGP